MHESGAPVEGLYDFQFELYPDPNSGGPLGSTVRLAAVPVSNGLFTVAMDFGAGFFNGQARWLQIGACSNAVGSYTTLSPRQPLLPTPYALFASDAAIAETATSVAAGAGTSIGLVTESAGHDRRSL